MAITFKEACDETVTYLDDIYYGYFTRDIVNKYVNNAQFEVQKLLLQAGQNFYVKCVYTNFIIGQRDYSLPDDFLKENRLEYVTDGFGTSSETTQALTAITLNQKTGVFYENGCPTGYYLTKSKLWVIPPPDNTYALKLHYSYRVAPCTLDNQNIDCPEEYMEMVPILAAMDGFIRDGRDPAPLVAKMAKYELLLKQTAARRTEDAPRMVVTHDDEVYW